MNRDGHMTFQLLHVTEIKSGFTWILEQESPVAAVTPFLSVYLKVVP